MTGVLLRCPNCGTTKSSFGECDACHEAQVRYYCTNHTPGKWLDAPKCGTCGAVFGERTSRPVSPLPTAPAPPPSSARPSTKPPRPPGAPVRTRAEAGRPRDASDRARGLPEVARIEDPVDRRDEAEVLLTRWQDMLRAAARRRASPGSSVADETLPARRGMGCFLRALVIFFFLFVTLIGGLFVTAGSMFRLF